jgi:2-iminobutanoate/2-iminopropanoate deaminase
MKYLILLSLTILTLFISCVNEKVERRVIVTDRAPQAIGPYSQAIQVGNQIFLAGQIPIDPNTGDIIAGGIKEQTRQVMINIQAVLEAAGFNFQDVTNVQIFLTELENYSTVNQIYATYFPVAPPARAVVEVARLPRDVMIEIMVSAIKA